MRLDLDTPPPCPHCGGTLRETEHPADEDGPASWSYTCDACRVGWDDLRPRLTIRTAPWTRALAAEVERLRGAHDFAAEITEVCEVLAPAVGEFSGNCDTAEGFARRAARKIEDLRREVARLHTVLRHWTHAAGAGGFRVSSCTNGMCGADDCRRCRPNWRDDDAC